jgi:hypothetical protein
MMASSVMAMTRDVRGAASYRESMRGRRGYGFVVGLMVQIGEAGNRVAGLAG